MRQEIGSLKKELAALRAAMPISLTTISEAADILQVSKRTIRRQIETGELRTVHIGNLIRVDLSQIRQSLHEQRQLSSLDTQNDARV